MTAGAPSIGSVNRYARSLALRARLLRIIGWALLAVIVLLPALWVLFFAPTTGKWATAFGSAVHDPKDFWITVLNGVTAAGLYFVVASGFTLIFGLMRVVNMAHGAFFLFGGYVALKLQRHLVGEGGSFGLTSGAGQPDALDRPGHRRHARDRRHGPRHATGVPALEPGAGPAPGADHDRDLDHPRRSDARPLRRRRRGHRVAARLRQVRQLARRGDSVHRDAVDHPRDRNRNRRPALAVAEAHAGRDGDPRRRRRPRNGLGARDQHPADVCDRVRGRLGAGGAGRGDRRLVREPGAGRRCELAACTRSSS